jgi:hypothetical protein
MPCSAAHTRLGRQRCEHDVIIELANHQLAEHQKASVEMEKYDKARIFQAWFVVDLSTNIL